MELQVGVGAESEFGAEVVHLHRMIDDQLGGQQWIDLLGIAAHLHHGVAHGGQIDDGRNAGEILQQHPRRHEGDFRVNVRFQGPVRQRLDVLLANGDAILGAEQILQQNLERERQPGCLWMRLVHGIEAVEGILLPADA